VARRFGSRWVLTGASLSVAPGEAVGLIGENGSGKSTLLRILCTLLRPTAGDAAVFGFDVRQSARDVRRLVGFFPPAPGMYEELTARENLEFVRRMGEQPSASPDAALEEVGLAGLADQRVRGFSSGMLRRLALARLRMLRPRLLLLDEPYNNLDTAGIALVNATIRETVSGGGSALVVVHDTASAAPVLTRWFGLRGGRVAPEELPA